MVKGRVPLAQVPGRKALGICGLADFIPEFSIIDRGNLYLRCPELAEVSDSSTSRRNMKIIPVHDTVGRRNDNGIRIQRKYEF